MIKKRLIERRPHYYDGQLLLEDDFRDEQTFHLNARCRHNLQLHGWGVVQGLEVLKQSDTEVSVNPGYAIDSSGRDLLVDQAINLDLAKFGPNDLVKIVLSYEEEGDGAGHGEHKRKDCYAELSACGMAEHTAAVTVATVQLDAQAKIEAISYENAKYARTVIGRESVTAAALDPHLRGGWFKMPFRPIPLVDIPAGEPEVPPFRVGVTRSISPAHRDVGPQDPGAGGTMAIPLPPGVRKLKRFRIAGEENQGKIFLQLYLGGWNEKAMKHVREEILNETIDKAPYSEIYSIPENFSSIDPEFHTLALSLRGTRRTSVSLVAVEIAY